MGSKKKIYRFVHPVTGAVTFEEKGGRDVLHATFIDFGEGFIHAGWSSQADFAKASKAARGTNPYGKDYTAAPATVVTAEERDAELAQIAAAEQAPAAPAAEVELCASNSNAKVMHYRGKGSQVSLCAKAATTRKANARQLADNNICSGCAAAHQG